MPAKNPAPAHPQPLLSFKKSKPMIVLHYIPTLTKRLEQASAFAQLLHESQVKTMETHLFSGKVNRREFVEKLTTVNPDIVHIHGCWYYDIACVERWALSRGYPVLLSLSNGMDERMMREDFWKKRLPQIFAFQFKTIRKATALHAISEKEFNDLKALGWRKRIVLVPKAENKESISLMCDSFHALYQKVIDTVKINSLNNKQKRWLWTIIQVAITPATDSPDNDTLAKRRTLAENIKTELTASDWRTIQIFTIDHSLQQMFLKGLKDLKVELTEVMTQLPPRFSVKKNIKEFNDRKKEKLFKDYVEHPVEKALAENIYRLKKILCERKIDKEWQKPYLLLLEVYSVIRWQYYDEGLLLSILKRWHLLEFSGRLFSVISSLLDLPLGFMPLDPINDPETEEMKKNLQNNL